MENGMKIYAAVVGDYETNCYLLVDGQSKEAAAVDCAVFDEKYQSMLARAGVKNLKYILLTHGHFDHVCGVKALKNACGGEVCICEKDGACLTDAEKNLNAFTGYAPFSPCEADSLLKEGDCLFLGEKLIRVLETPGHTAGSVCFLADGVLFSGDTLFRLSMGRTDLPGGSTRQLFASLARLGALDGDYDIYPGHGDFTTLDFEQANNRYLRSEKYAHNHSKPYI